MSEPSDDVKKKEVEAMQALGRLMGTVAFLMGASMLYAFFLLDVTIDPSPSNVKKAKRSFKKEYTSLLLSLGFDSAKAKEIAEEVTNELTVPVND